MVLRYRYNLLVLTFLASSLLLGSFTAAQNYSPDDYDNDSSSSSSSPSPSPEPQEPEADASTGLQDNNIFAPLQSPSSPVGQQDPTIQSPSPSPSPGGGEDLSNSYVPFPENPATAGPPPFSYNFSSLASPFSDEEDAALHDGVTLTARKTCQATDSPRLCETTLNPYIRGGEDAPALAKLAIVATGKLAEEALDQARSAVDGSWSTPEVAWVLNDCRNVYERAVKNFEKAKEAPEGDAGTVKSVLAAVITEVGDCEDAYAKTGMESPFASVSEKLTEMTGNCLSIVSSL